MNTERLLELAAKLDSLPPERFDYGCWYHDLAISGRTAPDLSACGTSACALGWATTIPSIAAAGLELRTVVGGGYGYVTLRDRVTANCAGSFAESIHAAREVFGLTHSEALFLFSPDDGSDGRPDEEAEPHEVAALIREFVAAGGIPAEYE